MEGMIDDDNSLALTPTWALATVTTILVSLGFFFHASLKQFGERLDNTKKKALLAAFEKIKEELMVFGLVSLLMGHWIIFVTKICIKSSDVSISYFHCAVNGNRKYEEGNLDSNSSNYSYVRKERDILVEQHHHCPEGEVPFASQKSLEQIHRLMFALGAIHVLYSFIVVALAMIKIYSWKFWERRASIIATQSVQEGLLEGRRTLTGLTSFISHRTSHPWSHNRALVWLLCFSRQFWSSINHDDYMALRYGFITTHELPFTYDFHKYMLRSMHEEFRDVVGISLPLWAYAICSIFLDFHATDAYFWLSFLPAILILLIGTKLHRIVVKLAVEITDPIPRLGNLQLNLRDELFWFGKPKLLLQAIQFISFQNAFEMAAFLWSLWEIRDSYCFMDNRLFVAIRLVFGIMTQLWCSFITFPLYIIVTQMDAKLKKTIVSEEVRNSLHGWKMRAVARRGSTSSSSPQFL